MTWYLPSRAFPLLEMYEATWQHSNILERIQIGVKIWMFYQNFSDLITKKISDRRPESILLVSETSLFKTFYSSLSFFLLLLFFIIISFYFICYSKVQQLQQLQLLSQSIHAQTYYTPKHTCNSTITIQGNAYCYFTSAIILRLVIF